MEKVIQGIGILIALYFDSPTIAAVIFFIVAIINPAFFGKAEEDTLECWLRKKTEKPLEEDMPIIDAHFHLWNPYSMRGKIEEAKAFQKSLSFFRPSLVRGLIRIALTETGVVSTFGINMTFLRPYTMFHFREDHSTHNIEAAIHIETTDEYYCEEAGLIQKYCDDFEDTGRIAAFVANVPLERGKEVEPVIKKLKEKYSNLRGVRCSITHHASKEIFGTSPADLTKRKKFREGLELLSKYDLTYDVWLFHHQCMDLVELAEAMPQILIIVNHIAQPLGIGPFKDHASTVDDWKQGINQLASCPNVYMKLSGLGMPCCGFGLDRRVNPPSSDELVSLWGPYYHYVINTFGVDRCMFASNFPMDRVSSSYTVLYNAFKKMTKEMPAEHRNQLFYTNAKRIYCLDNTDI